MNCTQCHFCRDYDRSDDAGFCKRYPPIYVADEAGDTILTNPVVSSSEWCGEFKPALHA